MEATIHAVASLRSRCPGERFYFFALITTEEAHAPFLAAWSHEALARTSAALGVDPLEIKWSYADSPYAITGEESFVEVRRLLDAEPRPTSAAPSETAAEVRRRMSAMERGLAMADRRGAFGGDRIRDGIFINVEVVPPVKENIHRASRLNPGPLLEIYLREMEL